MAATPTHHAQNSGGGPSPLLRVCAVLHAYYPDLLDEFVNELGPTGVVDRLIVTTAEGREDQVKSVLGRYALATECRVYPNRGRDILPFLHVAAELADGGHDIVLKLHTKRSSHRSDGDVWRKDVLQKLLSPEQVPKIRSAFERHPELGLVVPKGHVLAMHAFWGQNGRHITSVAERMGIVGDDFRKDVFPAGSMFYARLRALRPLLDAHILESEFETEQSQTDGTMAHAVERCIGISVRVAKMQISDTDAPEQPVNSGSTTYPFAKTSRRNKLRLSALLRRR